MDVKTLLICLVIINLMMSLFVYSIKFTQKEFPGINYWIYSDLILSVGYFLIFARYFIPDFFSVVIANTLFVATGLLRFVGLKVFFRNKNIRKTKIVSIAVVLIYGFVYAFFTHINDDIYTRTVIAGLVLSVVSIFIAVLILINKPEKKAFYYYITSFTYFLFPALFLIRIVHWTLFPDIRQVFNPAIANSAHFIGSFIIDILWTTMFFVINNQRINKQLTERNNEVEALLKGTRSVMQNNDFKYIAKQIFFYCKNLIGAQKGYVSIINEYEYENEVFNPDENETEKMKFPLPISGLRKEVYTSGQTAFINKLQTGYKITKSQKVANKNVLLAPLKIDGKTIGILNLTNKYIDFTNNDAKIVTSFAEFISIALKNSQNIEMLRKSESKLKDLNQTKDKFFSILAHDLKSPFHTLLGFSELLMENLNDYDYSQIQEFVGLINQTTQKTYDLLEDLLLWSKSQSGQLNVDAVEIDFMSECSEIIKSFSNRYEAKNITINISEKQKSVLFADLNMFKTILRNLISNAIKFTRKGGHIDIYTVISKSFVEICVADSGVGIKPENIEILWDISKPFTTVGTDQETGSGLGLVLCKEFVEKHDGYIKAESKFGEGSIFKFTLPGKSK